MNKILQNKFRQLSLISPNITAALLFTIILLFTFFFFNSCTHKNEQNYIFDSSLNTLVPNYSNFYKPGESEQNGKEIVIRSESSSMSLNPFYRMNTIDHLISSALFSSLFKINNENGQIENQLVKFYKLESEDTITIELESDNYFSNGELLTSRSVIASLNLINSILKGTFYKKLLSNSNNSNFNILQLTDYSFTISGVTNLSSLLYLLTEYPILHYKDIESKLSNIDDMSRVFSRLQIKNLSFSGPYTFSRFDKTSLTLSPNPYYTRGVVGPTKKSDLKIMLADFADSTLNYDIIPIKSPYDTSDNHKYLTLFTGYSSAFTGIYNTLNPNSQLYELNRRKILSKVLSAININDTVILAGSQNQTENENPSNQHFDQPIKIFIKDGDKSALLKNALTSTLSSSGIAFDIKIVNFTQFVDTVFYNRDFDLFYAETSFVYRDFVNLINGYHEYFTQYRQTLIENKSIVSESKDHFIELINNYYVTPIVCFKGYYLINKSILNFKLNSNFSKSLDITTLENLFKSNVVFD